MKDFFREIDSAIIEYESLSPYPQHSIMWITNRIDWCWKWKKISREQMEYLADRIIKVMKEQVL